MAVKRNILVVDDNQQNRRILCKILGADGYHVIEAENGQQAIDILDDRTQAITLVLLDLNMPVTATTIAPTSYAVNKTNFALPTGITFDTLNSYDLMAVVTDYFTSVSSVTGLGTKEVIMDFLADGTGVAFGKVATISNAVEVDSDNAF